jgi:transposase
MSQHQPHTKFAARIGIDWADSEHEVCIIDGEEVTRQSLPQSPEEIARWAEQLRRKFDGAPLAVALEQKRGPLINALVQYDQLVLFPINPKQLSRYRDSLFPSGTKNDRNDAWLLARFVQEHQQTLRRFRPGDTQSRQLARLCELRRKAVDNRKKLVQQLTDALKQYFPLILQVCGPLAEERTLALIARWPHHRKLQRAHPRIIRRFLKDHGMRGEERRQEFVDQIRRAAPLTTDRAVVEPQALWARTLVGQIRGLNKMIAEFEEQIEELFGRHEDADLFRPLPGAGKALAPRLASIFGSDRDRFTSAEEVAVVSGVAPVTRQTGRSVVVKRRLFCPKFLRQTFHEFADHSRKSSRWARAYYELQRSRGKKHSAAVRSLAYKWIRILYQVWKTRTSYDEQRYLRQLKKTNSPLLAHLETAT